MNGTLQTTLSGVPGLLMGLAVSACSTPPRSTPDATVATATTTRPAAARTDAPANANASAPTSDRGDPDPLEALHDAEPVPVDKPELLHPHTLRIVLDEKNDVRGNVGRDPLLAEDGSIVIALEDRSSFEAEHALVVLLVRELDHPERDREMIVVDSPDCGVRPNPPRCDFAGAEASTRKVNAFLAKHKWVAFREYLPWMPPSDMDDCYGLPLARHFRAAGFDFQFREPHLRIARSDGVVAVDRKDLTVTDHPEGSSKPIRTYVANVGMDVHRRAGFIVVARCRPERRMTMYRGDWLFFRLPKPSK